MATPGVYGQPGTTVNPTVASDSGWTGTTPGTLNPNAKQLPYFASVAKPYVSPSNNPGTSGLINGNSANPNPYGTASGPGILQQWFNERASGTDPGWEYAVNRNTTNLANQYAAGGQFNSGAAKQGQSDMLANMAAQREGQLDTLAGGASGERQGAINSMFNQGLGLAGGQAGTAGQYDTSAAGALSTSLATQLALAINKAGVGPAANQQGIKNAISLGGLLGG